MHSTTLTRFGVSRLLGGGAASFTHIVSVEWLGIYRFVEWKKTITFKPCIRAYRYRHLVVLQSVKEGALTQEINWWAIIIQTL